MEQNTQILTIDLFKRICEIYVRALAKSKGKEDNLETFSQFMKKAFKKLNIVWEGDNFEGLYSMYHYSKDRTAVDFTNVAQTSSEFHKYLNLAQNAGFDVVDNPESFASFVGETTAAENMDDNTRKALFTIFKLANTNRKLFPDEKKALVDALTDKRDNLKLRKMHRVRDFFLKKGGTLLTIAACTFAGIVIATAALPAGGLISATALGNVSTFGTIGAAIGGVTAWAGIKIKNAITNFYYKKRYGFKRTKKVDQLKDFEDGLISLNDLNISKKQLIEKAHATNEKILALKQPLPEAKGFGKVKNFFVGIGRKIKLHTLNVVNRNRIHAISDNLQEVNSRINAIASSEVLTSSEKAIKIANLQTLREKAARVRGEELLDSLASALVAKKPQPLENLDIYAKDLLDKADKKDKKKVRAKAREIIDNLLTGDASLLAGENIKGCEVGLTIDRLNRMLPEHNAPAMPTPEEVLAMERERLRRRDENARRRDEEAARRKGGHTDTAPAGTTDPNPIKKDPKVDFIDGSVDDTIASEGGKPPVEQPKERILPKLTTKERDIAAETAMLEMLKNEKVLSDLIANGFTKETIAIFVQDLAARQSAVNKKGEVRAKTRMRMTKFWKETEGIQELYDFLTRYNANNAQFKNPDSDHTV